MAERSCELPVSASGIDRRRLLAALGALPITGCTTTAARSGPVIPTDPGPRFALLRPEDVRERAQRPSSPGAGFLRRAERNLAREPDPIATIHVEGTLPGQGIYDRSLAATRDFPVLLDFAIAWAISGDERYRAAADRYLKAWTAIYRVSLNPIDEERFDIVVLASDLVRGNLEPETARGVEALLLRLRDGYLQAVTSPPRRGSDVNNWQSHRLKIGGMAAFALGEREPILRLRAALDAHLARHIVTADGEVIDFGERDALHYVVYSLMPLTELCLAAHAHGEDWLRRPTPLGASVATAIDWLVPYADGRRTHQEFVRSKVRFDAERARAGLAHFGGAWDRARALELFALATALDRRWEPTLASISTTAGKQPSERTRLLFL